MAQSLKAIRPEGVISIIGFLGGMSKDQPSFLDCLSNVCTVRGVVVGSRLQFEKMNEAIDAGGIKPVVDEKVFALEDLKEAYQYMVSFLVLIHCYINQTWSMMKIALTPLSVNSGIKSISAN